MGEIDDTNHAEDERKADAEKRIDAAQQKPRNSDLDKKLHSVPSPGIRIASQKDSNEAGHCPALFTAYLLKGLIKVAFTTAAPSGHTGTNLPPLHSITKGSARIFCPPSSNFTPQPLAVDPAFNSKAAAV